MFKIAQRYLAARFIHSFIACTFFFIIFLLIIQSFRLIRIVTNKDVEFQMVMGLIGHMAIASFPMVIPLAALFATVHTVSRFSENSEITAMRSFGLRKSELLTPFFALGILIFTLSFILSSALVPQSKKISRNIVAQVSSRAWLSSIGPGQFFTEIPGVTLFSEEKTEEGDLRDVFIRISKGKEEQIILAKKGVLIKFQKKMEAPVMRMSLEEGHIIKMLEGEKIEKIIFDRYEFPLLSGEGANGIIAKDSMKSSFELGRLIENGKLELKGYIDKEKHNQMLSREERQKKRELVQWLPRGQLEFWNRWNSSLAVLAFIFLGFGLGIKKSRRKNKYTESLGIVAVLCHYTLLFGGAVLARDGKIPPFVSAFVPILFVSLMGGFFLKKIDWSG